MVTFYLSRRWATSSKPSDEMSEISVVIAESHASPELLRFAIVPYFLPAQV
jgi:hypothetical protein